MNANRKYKDSVFTSLFSDKRRLLELYNAITGSDLPIETPMEIATLTDVLFTDRRNDIAFVLNGKIVVLIEHQSTINENMPVRLLIYIARVYEKLIDNDAVYKRKLLKIPRPDFIILYNGTEPFPREKTLRLSDAFVDAPESVVSGLGGFLELEARVINLNDSRNDGLIKRCHDLNGYVILVKKIHENRAAGLTVNEAVIKAVNECVSENILADYLKEHISEVYNMMTLQFDINEAERVWKQEAREEGRAEGESGSMEIISLLRSGLPPDKIAGKMQIPIAKVIKWKEFLNF